MCRPPSWWGLLPLPQESYPALGLRRRFSALRASFGSLSQQSLFPQMRNVLIETLQDIVSKIYKKIRGSRHRTHAAGEETFVRTHPRVHPTNAGAPSSASSRLATAVPRMTECDRKTRGEKRISSGQLRPHNPKKAIEARSPQKFGTLPTPDRFDL